MPVEASWVKLMAQAISPPVMVVPAGIVICCESANTTVALARTSSANRVPEGITMSLLVLPLVVSVVSTVMVNAT